MQCISCSSRTSSSTNDFKSVRNLLFSPIRYAIVSVNRFRQMNYIAYNQDVKI